MGIAKNPVRQPDALGLLEDQHDHRALVTL
jgi:hypothetical protein